MDTFLPGCPANPAWHQGKAWAALLVLISLEVHQVSAAGGNIRSLWSSRLQQHQPTIWGLWNVNDKLDSRYICMHYKGKCVCLNHFKCKKEDNYEGFFYYLLFKNPLLSSSCSQRPLHHWEGKKNNIWHINIYLYIFLTVCVMGEWMTSDRNGWTGITFNEAGSSHGPFRLKKKKKKCWFYMPKSWKGLDSSRLWYIFPDGICHFVFCINWLNLLALCTYFRGNHSLLSIGQKSSLALEPSWSGEGGMRIHRRHPKLPMFRLRKEVGPGLWILIT